MFEVGAVAAKLKSVAKKLWCC